MTCVYVWGGGGVVLKMKVKVESKSTTFTLTSTINQRVVHKHIMNEEQKENPSARENLDMSYFGFILFFAYLSLFD